MNCGDIRWWYCWRYCECCDNSLNRFNHIIILWFNDTYEKKWGERVCPSLYYIIVHIHVTLMKVPRRQYSPWSNIPDLILSRWQYECNRSHMSSRCNYCNNPFTISRILISWLDISSGWHNRCWLEEHSPIEHLKSHNVRHIFEVWHA